MVDKYKYRILPVDNQKKERHPILAPPFSLFVNAPKGSGKTTMLINLLTRNEFYKGVFNDIFWFSPTSKLDEKLNILKTTTNILKENTALLSLLETEWKKSIRQQLYDGDSTKFTGKIENFVEEYSEDILKSIIDKQKSQIEFLRGIGKQKEMADKVLLVFDDSVSDKLLMKRNSLFQKLNFNCRHYNISIIVVSQNYKSISKPIRTNSSAWILYELADSEKRVFYEENSNGLTYKEWLEKYSTATNEPYTFLYINYQEPDKRKRLKKNFDEVL